MSSLRVFVGLLGAAAVCAFGQTSAVVFPNTDGWSWTPAGAEPLWDAQSCDAVIPANGQLTRSVATGDLAVTLSTQPVVGLSAQEWPVLELGFAALVFFREGNNGELSIVVGDAEPITLPVAIALDDDGRWLSPMEIGLVHLGDELVVQVGARSWTFGMPATPSQDVVLSAGAKMPWELDSLSLFVPSAELLTSASVLASSESGASTDIVAGGATRSAGANATTGHKHHADTQSDGATTSVATSASSATSTFEVFTPPSVRFGRADAVRVVLAQSTQK